MEDRNEDRPSSKLMTFTPTQVPGVFVLDLWRTNEHDQIHLMPKNTCELVVVYSML